MNDTGADKQIDEEAKENGLDQVDGAAVRDAAKHEAEASTKQKSDYQDPSIWWFASTGAPLVAGAFGPLASGFNICALARSWRVYITGQVETQGVRIPDPGWLLGINAVSLFFALVANMALLLNMSQRVRFKLTQTISTIGFALAGILLVAIIIAFAASPTYHLPANDPAAPSANHALSSAFYYAIEAAVLYLVMTALMGLTSWGVWRGHFEGGFRLTIAQRTLMLQTMFFVIYIMLAALIFSHVEGWEFLDALYWADTTLLTIGLGSDFAPTTHTGRSLLFFFAIGGIIIIGLVIGSIRTLVLDRGKRKLSARILEKKRITAIKSINPKTHRIRVGTFSTMKFDNSDLDHWKRRELEFDVMRGVQKNAERDRKWMALAISSTATALLWFLGAVVFFESEKHQAWTYFESLYFCYVVLLTIGYGDEIPRSNSGKAFFVVWTLLAVPTLTILISNMSETVIAGFSDLTGWLGSITVLPGDSGFRATLKTGFKQLSSGRLDLSELTKDTVPGALEGAINANKPDGRDPDMPDLLDSVTERLAAHLEDEELSRAIEAGEHGDSRQRDIHFYHVVLAREIRSLMRDLVQSTPKQYSWEEWEYYLKLMNNVDAEKEPDRHLVPEALRQTRDITKFRAKGQQNHDFTWLGRDSPLLSYKSETEWILERLGTTLERELQIMNRNLGKGLGDVQNPPVSLSEMLASGTLKMKRNEKRNSGGSGDNDSERRSDGTAVVSDV